MQDQRAKDIQNIIDSLDPSVRGKFERCAQNDWCSAGKSNEGANRFLCKKSLAYKVSKKLSCMKGKLGKLVKTSKVLKKSHTVILDRCINMPDDQITKGSNTPVSSRPNSMTLTMDQIQCFPLKNVETQH